MEISNLKHIVDGLYRTLKIFNGKVLICLLKFLYTLDKVLDAMGTSEAAVVRTITY